MHNNEEYMIVLNRYQEYGKDEVIYRDSRESLVEWLKEFASEVGVPYDEKTLQSGLSKEQMIEQIREVSLELSPYLRIFSSSSQVSLTHLIRKDLNVF